jgi:VanZ family protein
MAAALWAVLIEVLTSWPSPPTFGAPAGADKGVHVVLYAVLAFLVARAVRPGRPSTPVMLSVVLALAAWGAADEWHQRFSTDRSPSLADWLADVAGVVAGVGARRLRPVSPAAGGT